MIAWIKINSSKYQGMKKAITEKKNRFNLDSMDLYPIFKIIKISIKELLRNEIFIP